MKQLLNCSAFLALVVLVISCKNTTPSTTPNASNEMVQEKDSNVVSQLQGSYSGSLYKGNFVWGGAMNLCWTNLQNTIIKAPIELATQDSTALKMINAFNHPIFTTQDLDAASYYIKAGYGPSTVDAINKECKAKFPQKSFSDLNINLDDKDLISYAYFIKEVQYLIPFSKKEVAFRDSLLQGFEALDAQKENVRIINYTNDNQFIIALKLKDEADELILAKGYPMNDLNLALKAVITLDKKTDETLGTNDFFQMPLLSLDFKRNYVELLNLMFKNVGFTDYILAEMYENIKFDLDETGAKVENEAVMTMKATAVFEETPPKQRFFYLNQPFWLIMKRKSSTQPYFVLGVNNDALMKKLK